MSLADRKLTYSTVNSGQGDTWELLWFKYLKRLLDIFSLIDKVASVSTYKITAGTVKKSKLSVRNEK